MHKLLLLNGPNLNLLGQREPTVYGKTTLKEIEELCSNKANQLNMEIECFQSNSESELINKIHSVMNKIDFIVINPAAYTHTSVALRDALLGVDIPFIEIHLSNIHKREAFRHHSYFSDHAIGVICGLGYKGYIYAIEHANQLLLKKN